MAVETRREELGPREHVIVDAEMLQRPQFSMWRTNRLMTNVNMPAPSDPFPE